MRFRSRFIADHFRILQRFVSNHFWVLCEVCFGSLCFWKTHDLWRRPSFLTLSPTLRAKIYSLQISWFLQNCSLALLCLCVRSGFSSVFCHSTSSHSDDNVWLKLTPLHPESAGQPEFVWRLTRVVYPPFKLSCIAFFYQFLSSVHVQGDLHSSMGYKLLDYIVHSWQRNFSGAVSGDWLVTLRLLIFFDNFAS